MVFYKKHLKIFSVLMTCSILFASCYHSDNQIVKMGQHYDGKSIFKGLYFLESEFVDNLSILSNSPVYKVLQKNNDVYGNLISFGDAIIDHIDRNNPEFFADFESLMKSGNQNKIAQAIASGSHELVKALREEIGDSGYSYNEIQTLVGEENLEGLIDQNGEINEEILNKLFEKNDGKFNINNLKSNDFASKQSEGQCVVAGVVLIAGIYVFVGAVFNIAAAVNVGVAVNAAAAVNGYAYINVEVQGGLNFSGGEINTLNYAGVLDTEVLIDQLSKIDYLD